MAQPDSAPPPGTVRVLLIDAANGKPFAQTDLPADQLPETFTISTQLHLGDQDWQVRSADPATRDAIVAQGSVVLTLSRLETIDPALIGYSLPTICEHLPPFGPMAGTGVTLEFRLDDWRQIEFVAKELGAEVAAELAAVQAVYAEQAGRQGFRRMHTRRELPEPLFGRSITSSSLQRRFGGEWGDRVQTEDLAGAPTLLEGGAWFRLPGGLVGYSVTTAGRVAALGLAVPRGPLDCMGGRPPVIDLGADRALLASFAREHGLLLIDWCAAQLFAWD
jgi:hypothetical protein